LSFTTLTQPDDSGGESHGPVPKDWKPGDVIFGLYEVKEVLGEGGMGAVHRVHHRAWNSDLAVKSPTERLLRKANGVERVERECETWINLALHPNVVSCYYVRRIADVPRIFAEYVDGGNLWDWIQTGKLYEGDNTKALQTILQVAIQSAWGIHHAHTSGVIHRDLKPQNFMLTASGNVKITDFGLAQVYEAASAESLAQDGVGMTPAYGSPEQFARTELTPQTDLWSWALCVLQMFTVKVTWKKGIEGPQALERFLSGERKYKAVPVMPERLADLLRQCFQQSPADRPQGMLSLVEPLKAIFQESTNLPFPESTPRALDAAADNLNNRAVSLLDLGKRKEAVKLWEKALEADSQHAEAMFNLGLVYWRAGGVSDDRFLRRLKDIADQNLGRVLPAILRIQAHMERGDIEAASRITAEARRRFPERGDLNFLTRQIEELRPYARNMLHTYQAHADRVTAVRMSDDGRYAVSASEDNTLKLWTLPEGECIRTFEGHQGSVYSIDMSHDNTLVMSAARDRTLRIWDRGSGECARDIAIDREADGGAALAPDGRHALVRKGGAQFVLLSILNEQTETAFTGHTGWIHAMAFCPDERHVLSASADGTVRVWNRETGVCMRAMAGHEDGVNCLAVATEGTTCVSGGQDGEVILWNWETGETLRVMKAHRGPVHCIALSADGIVAASGGEDGTVRMWATRRGRCVRTFTEHEGPVNTLSISQDGSIAISGGKDRTLRLWKLTKNIPYRSPMMICKAQRTETALSAQVDYQRGLSHARRALDAGNSIAACQVLRKVRALEGYGRNADVMREWARLFTRLPRGGLRGAWESAEIFAHDGGVNSISLNKDGRFVLTGGHDGGVRLWAMETFKCLRHLTGHTASVKSVSLSADGRKALSGGEDQVIILWDLASGSMLRSFEGVAGSAEAVALSPDARFALSGGWDLRLWEVGTGRHLRTFEGHTADVVSLRWGTDGTFAISGSSDETIRIWDISTGRCLRVIEGANGAVRACDLSLNGSMILSASSNIWSQKGLLCLWNTQTGEQIHALDGHRAPVRSVCITPDGKYGLSASQDGAWRLWDLHSGTPLRVFEGHGSSIDAITVTPDSRMAITGDHRGKLQFWTLDWELVERDPASWEDAAEPILDSFLTQHTAYGGKLPEDYMPTSDELMAALQRKGRPEYTESDITSLMYTLGCAGLGFLTRSGVEAQLEAMASRRGRFTLFGRRRK
jgi:WD40 repeat protein/serine/threonine protein kinase